VAGEPLGGDEKAPRTGHQPAAHMEQPHRYTIVPWRTPRLACPGLQAGRQNDATVLGRLSIITIGE
jgi:hypothetical protein